MIAAVEIERARAVPLQDEIARRGITPKRVGVELIGPCPVCDGMDRLAINTKKGVFNCRGCKKGRRCDRPIGRATALRHYTRRCERGAQGHKDRRDAGRLAANWNAGKKSLRAAIQRRQPDLVALDPYVKLHALEENDNRAMDFVCDLLATLAIEYDIAVDAPHHTKKGQLTPGDANSGRGASATRDAGRLIYTLTTMSERATNSFSISPDERITYIRLDKGKVNLAPPARTATWLKLMAPMNMPRTPAPPGLATRQDGLVRPHRQGATRQRVWLDVLVYTGLRRGDAVCFGRQHIRNGVGTIKTEKTSTVVTLRSCRC